MSYSTAVENLVAISLICFKNAPQPLVDNQYPLKPFQTRGSETGILNAGTQHRGIECMIVMVHRYWAVMRCLLLVGDVSIDSKEGVSVGQNKGCNFGCQHEKVPPIRLVLRV